MDSNGNGEKRKTYAEIADILGKAEGEIRASFNNIAKLSFSCRLSFSG